MRYSIIVAGLVAFAAALPTIVPTEESSLAVRTESLDTTTVALEARQNWFDYNMSWNWPETEFAHGNYGGQFLATNQGNGNYLFKFWNTTPPNGVKLNFRISGGGKTLASVDVDQSQTATVTVPKTGSNFNVVIGQA